MYPFEVMGQDGRRHLHVERWGEHRRRLFESYPVPHGKTRIELELYHPRNSLAELPLHWNPHGEVNLPAWFPVYSDPAWSTVFEVCEFEYSLGGYLRMFVEDGHDNPWGERIRLISTSSEITDDHANRMAFFRGQHWLVLGPMFYRPPIVHYAEHADQLLDSVAEHADQLLDSVYAFNHTTLFEALALMNYDIECSEFRLPSKKHKIDWGRDGF